MESWKTLSRRVVFNHSKYLTVEEHAVQLPDGRVIHDWPWIITPDYVNVLAVTGNGRFLCFRQVKYAIEGTSLAAMGGYLEAGEDPLAAAQRELMEETGYAALQWIGLGSLAVGGNRGIATAHLFLACDAYQVTDRQADDLEEQELLLLSQEEIEGALLAGEFKGLSWAAVVALGLLALTHRSKET